MNGRAVEILLVEDAETDAELTMRALKRAGVGNYLKWAKDGAEALDFLFAPGTLEDRATTPKVILLDLHLPKVSGVEVLRRLKSDVHARTIPVVMLTSSREERDLEECYRLGVNSYISKPVEFGEFAKVVSQLGLYWLLVNRLPGG